MDAFFPHSRLYLIYHEKRYIAYQELGLILTNFSGSP